MRRLNATEVATLHEMVNSEVFASILRILADTQRTNLLPLSVSAHNVQNAQAAAVCAGQMDVLERLPELFRELLRSHTQ